MTHIAGKLSGVVQQPKGLHRNLSSSYRLVQSCSDSNHFFGGASVIYCCCLARISLWQWHLCPILAMEKAVNAKIGCKCLHDGHLSSSRQHSMTEAPPYGLFSLRR